MKTKLLIGLLAIIAITLSVMGMMKKSPQPLLRSAQQNSAAQTPLAEGEIAGEIFGIPIPMSNYYFAKRVHLTFKDDEAVKFTPQQMEDCIFQNLIYSYEANKRGIKVTDEEMDQWIDSVLQAVNVKIEHKKDPEAYKKWITESLKEEVILFENQMRYLAEIEKLKREMVKEMKVEVSEDEMLEDFMNIQNHVGGEYTLFETKEEAETFYEKYKNQLDWEAMKKEKPDLVKPFSLITIQAIIDLWGVPKEEINAFHQLALGSVGKPLPFGRKWGVFRLLEERTGKPEDYNAKKEDNRKRVEIRKQYKARDQWLKDIIKEANLKVFVKPDEIPMTAPTSKEEAVKAETAPTQT